MQTNFCALRCKQVNWKFHDSMDSLYMGSCFWPIRTDIFLYVDYTDSTDLYYPYIASHGRALAVARDSNSRAGAVCALALKNATNNACSAGYYIKTDSSDADSDLKKVIARFSFTLAIHCFSMVNSALQKWPLRKSRANNRSFFSSNIGDFESFSIWQLVRVWIILRSYDSQVILLQIKCFFFAMDFIYKSGTDGSCRTFIVKNSCFLG